LSVKIIIDSVDGEVLDVQAWGTTHISSSGGGGRLHDGTGYISAPQITSRSGEHCQVMLRTTAGDEREVDMNDGVGFREGSRIRLVYVKPETGGEWIRVSETNLDTGSHAKNTYPAGVMLATLSPSKTIDQIKKKGEGFIAPNWALWLLWIIALFAIYFLLPILAMIAYGFWRKAALKRLAREISQDWQTRAATLEDAMESIRTNGGGATFEI
jgi:hypothetical protein